MARSPRANKDRATETSTIIALWAGVTIVIAIGLFYRYLKFFKHYTEEVFRDYAEPVAKA